MDADAYWYSLQQQAKEAGVDFETYVEGLNLLDQAEIDRVWDQLNISDRAKSSRVYINSKLPFGYNYVDTNYRVNHDRDTQGSHGSHVAGIAAANDYIKNADGSFSPALDTAKMQGVAPDAQILTMKVFGNYGGAYESDYMAAIEDAIVLGADAVNLSLGSAAPGMSRSTNEAYQAIMDNLTDSGVMVCISAGNSGGWSDYDLNLGYLYADEVSMHTAGAPGTYTNALTVASADNVGNTGHFFAVGDKKIFYTESTNYGNAPITSLSGTYEYVVLTGYGSVEDYAALGDALEGRIAVCSRGQLTFTEKATNAVNAGAVGTIIFNNEPGTINLALDGLPGQGSLRQHLPGRGRIYEVQRQAGHRPSWKRAVLPGRADHHRRDRLRSPRRRVPDHELLLQLGRSRFPGAEAGDHRSRRQYLFSGRRYLRRPRAMPTTPAPPWLRPRSPASRRFWPSTSGEAGWRKRPVWTPGSSSNL